MSSKLNFWDAIKQSIANIDWNMPCPIGGTAEDQAKIIRAYNESKYGTKNEIHLHQHNYFLIDKKTGEKIKLDAERYEVWEEK